VRLQGFFPVEIQPNTIYSKTPIHFINKMFYGSANLPLLIAEVGGSHAGSTARLRSIVSQLCKFRNINIKYQVYDADSLVSLAASPARHAHFSRLTIPPNEYIELIQYAANFGIVSSVSAWSLEFVDLFAPLCPYLKVGSGDITFLPLIRKIGSLGKPLVISTGMSTDSDILNAVQQYTRSYPNTFEEACKNLAVLHCSSIYPTPSTQACLDRIPHLKNLLPPYVTIGYSHHSVNHDLILYALAAGAKIVEFHFTDDVSDVSFRDNQLSLDFDSLKELTAKITTLLSSLPYDPGSFVANQQLLGNLNSFRRSLYALRDLSSGSILQSSDFVALRPLSGIPVEYSDTLFDGSYRLVADILSGDPLLWEKVTTL